MSQPPSTKQPPLDKDGGSIDSLIEPSLFRLTSGLPRRELKVIIDEAKACEAALEKEIQALQDYKGNKAAVDVMLSTELTSADRFYTVSALLGRLREPLATPHPPNSTLPQVQQTTKQPKKKGDTNELDKVHALLAMEQNPDYRKVHDSTTMLLSVWKKISSHRTAAVFRRPVNVREAPGYAERILFPMDLSLVKKMITANMITSLAELHERIGLICHNCVKFNGRESDYGVVTREFEAHVDECILAALNNKSLSRTTTPTAADLASIKQRATQQQQGKAEQSSGAKAATAEKSAT